MRVALLYPPPWKLPGPGEPLPTEGGAPQGFREGDLDADFHQIPYGLLALAAGATRAGHQVKVLNLSSFAWSKVEEIVRSLDAEVWGMSAWTANRRGVAMVAECIKRHAPRSHVVVGGPHATPLASELLGHFHHVDTVCVGESDVTFLELLERLQSGDPTAGLAGTAWREGDRVVVVGPERAAIGDLDALASVHETFDTHILMTSRGCPWACTFCGAETSWGRGFRAHSVERVLADLAQMSARLPVKMVQIKDDTFTTNKKRVLELCAAMRARGLRLLWSCDTRVDLLTDELCRELRLAGCQRLSLGVESGSQGILDAIDKKITVDEIVRSTELARKWGIKVRHYMMLGNRGETADTFRETLAFLERARPHEYIFSCLSIYPGTRDFTDAERAGWLQREAYFEGDFQELKTPFDASDETTRELNAWFAKNSGLRRVHVDTLEERLAQLERLGDHHAAHMDVGAALYHAGDLAGAERHVKKALDLGYPCPGLAYNHLACIAKARGELDAMMELFSRAAKEDPQHWVLVKNVQAARAWFKERGPARGLPLALEVSHDFQLLERTAQPVLPGPLADDYATWAPAQAPAESGGWARLPGQEGSAKPLAARGHLPVVKS